MLESLLDFNIWIIVQFKRIFLPYKRLIKYCYEWTKLSSLEEEECIQASKIIYFFSIYFYLFLFMFFNKHYHTFGFNPISLHLVTAVVLCDNKIVNIGYCKV